MSDIEILLFISTASIMIISGYAYTLKTELKEYRKREQEGN